MPPPCCFWIGLISFQTSLPCRDRTIFIVEFRRTKSVSNNTPNKEDSSIHAMAWSYTYQLHLWVFLIATTTTTTLSPIPRLMHNSEATDGSFLSVRWPSADAVGLKWGDGLGWGVTGTDGQLVEYPVGNARTLRQFSAVWWNRHGRQAGSIFVPHRGSCFFPVGINIWDGNFPPLRPARPGQTHRKTMESNQPFSFVNKRIRNDDDDDRWGSVARLVIRLYFEAISTHLFRKFNQIRDFLFWQSLLILMNSLRMVFFISPAFDFS